MESKIIKVFYGEDLLPYKDSAREVHYPISGSTFACSNNTTEIRFYVDQIGGTSGISWVIVSKLPNGQLGYEVLSNIGTDYDLNTTFLRFNLSSYYTQYKGVVKLALRGYNGTITFDSGEDDDDGIYTITGTPLIEVTGTIDVAINYSPFVNTGAEILPTDVDKILAALSGYNPIGNSVVVVTTLPSDLTNFNDGQIFYLKSNKQYYILSSGNLILYYDGSLRGDSISPYGSMTLADIYSTTNGAWFSGYNLNNLTPTPYPNALYFVRVRTYLAGYYVHFFALTEDNEIVYGSSIGAYNSTLYSIIDSVSSIQGVIADRTWTANQLTTALANYYTKTQIDNKFSELGNVLEYKGSATVAQINALNSASIDIGDVYNLSDDGTLTYGNIDVVAGDNVAWDGTQWDKLGSSVSIEVDDKLSLTSIKPVENKAIANGILMYGYQNLIKVGKNKFDKDNAISGYYQNGTIYVGDYKHYYIPVKSGDVLTSNNNMRLVAQTDVFGNYLSMISINNTTSVTMTNDGYAVVSVSLDYIQTIMVVVNDTLPLNYEPFMCEYVGLRNQDGNVLIKDHTIDYTKIVGGHSSANLLDISKVKYKTFCDGDTESENNNYDCSDFIKMENGKTYTFSTTVRGVKGFSTSKAYVQNISANPVSSIVAPFDGYFRVNFYHKVADNFMIVEGNTLPSNFVAYGYYLDGLLMENQVNKKMTVSVVDNDISISSIIDGQVCTQTLKKTSVAKNKLFNFDSLIRNGTTIKACADDITPFRIQNTTIGANHGYLQCWSVDNTDKTSEDIGSQWTDGTNTYTLVNITTDSKLQFIGETEEYSSPTVNKPKGVAPTATLTHVSDATHTSSISITSIEQDQLFPSVNNRQLKIVVDGMDITTGNGTYNADELCVYETYNIMDYKAIADFLHANIGGSYHDDDIEGCAKVSICYRFDNLDKCVVTTTFTVLKNIYTSNANGIVQAQPLLPIYSNRFFHIGDVKVKDGLDFSNIVDEDDITGTIDFTDSDLKVATIPPNKMVSLQFDSNNDRLYGFAIGYIVDKSASSNEDRILRCGNQSYVQIREDTLKMYPNCFSRNTATSTVFTAGQMLTAIGYRAFFGSGNPKATSAYHIVENGACYVFLDYNQNVTNEVYKLEGYEGCPIQVLQTSGSFTLVNDLVGGDGITFSVSGGLGTAILKISNVKVDLSNYVTLDTDQTITGAKTILNNITIGNNTGNYSVDFIGGNSSRNFKITQKTYETEITTGGSGYNYKFMWFSNAGGNIKLFNGMLNNTYGLTLPDTTSWTADKVIATTDQAFNVINASDITSNTLTQDQYDLITNGKPTLIKGTLLGIRNPILTSPYEGGGGYIYGLKIGQTSTGYQSLASVISQYRIHTSTKLIETVEADRRISLEQIYNINGKSIPNYPSSTGTFVLKCVDGTLTWVSE